MRRSKTSRKRRVSSPLPKTPSNRSPNVSTNGSRSSRSPVIPSHGSSPAVPFAGFIRSPSEASTEPSSPLFLLGVDDDGIPIHPTSPLAAKNKAVALTFDNVILDMCSLTVTLSPKRVAEFSDFMSSESIYHHRLPSHHPLYASTIRIASSNDFHRLVCKLPGRIQKVVYN